ncbi:MAG: substrate-binding domain-containing protein [Verrucomicrobiae bacterium]|nr:substrate-binding domain-containing protein [Verrucomicrobiae bacterium]
MLPPALTPWTHTAELRFKAYLKAMQEACLEIRPEYSLQVAAREVECQGVQETDVFKAMAEPPQAIIALHDLMALNVIRRCKERGLRVPEDFAVAGFDDLPIARMLNPPLTTVRQAFQEMGRRAVQILAGHIRGEVPPPFKECLPCELIIRESCIRQSQMNSNQDQCDQIRQN